MGNRSRSEVEVQGERGEVEVGIEGERGLDLRPTMD